LLSGDGLLNIAPPDPLQDTPPVVQHAELLETDEQLPTAGPGIHIELDSSGQPETDPSDALSTDIYQAIFTLSVDDNTNDENETADDLDTGNVESAQVNDDLTELSNDSDGDIENKITAAEVVNITVEDESKSNSAVPTDDGSMPTNTSDADSSVEFATSIEIRGPPAQAQAAYQNQIAFVDLALNQDFQFENVVPSGVVVSVLSANANGIQHITDVLSGYSNLSAVHIISHGAPGQVNLGTEILDSNSLQRHAREIGTWGNALTENGDILIYGCAVARSEVGIELIEQVATFTGADVAASTNPTGNVGYGGDWVLELSTGQIEAELPWIQTALEAYSGTLDLVINEIHADPDATQGDANGDGIRDTYEDEFVEIVNDSGSTIDISGWTLSDDDGDDFTFPVNTTLVAGQAAVLFGGGTPAGNFGSALVFTDDGSIGNGLGNGGDLVELRNGSTLIDSTGYGSEGGDNQSLTRDPDITGSFAKHSTASGSGGTLFSPGTKVDGSSFAGVVSIIINEVDCDTFGTDAAEFIELYDGGIGNAPLDGLVVVLFDGDGDQSYQAFDLDGYSTNSDGFFVLGNTAVPNVDLVFPDDTLKNGPDAVALHVGDDGDFPNDTPVTSANVIDAIIYDTGQADDSGLLDVLTPGQAQIDEDGQGDQENHSNSRVPDGGTQLDTSTYLQQIPTPGTSNENQPPTDIDVTPNSVAENEAAGTLVGVLTTTDQTPNDIHMYQLVAGTGSENNGSFRIDGDQLLTSGQFDYEAKDSYNIRVRSTDWSGLYYEKALNITVTDVNEPPAEITLSANTVAENTDTGSGYAVGILSSTDPDIGAPFNALTFSIQGGADSGKFSVDGSNNLVLTNGVLDLENPTDANADGAYEVTVRVTDGGTPALIYDEAFTVTVTSINETPIITSDGGGATATVSVAENTTAVTDVQSSDDSDSEGLGLTYSLTGGVDQGFFSINTNTGVLTFNSAPDFANPLDADTGNNYQVQVTVTDSDTLTDVQDITVSVTDASGTWTIGPSNWTSAGLTLSRDGNVLHVYETGTTNNVIVPMSIEEAANIVITARDSQNDTLTIDFSSGNPIPAGGVGYEGGTAGNDTLVLTGGSFTTTTYNFANESDGSIDLSGSTITYTGLEPISSTINVVDVVLNYSGANETITVTDAGGGQTTVASTAGETTTFTNPSGTLTINASGGDDVVNITSLAAGYPGHVTINGQGDMDTVNFGGNVSLAADRHLSVAGDTIEVNSALSTTGIGYVTLNANRNIDMNSGSSITTVNGDTSLETNPAGAVTGSFVGIDVDSAVLTATGMGAITINGCGGDTSSDDGIAIDNTTVRVVDGTIQMTGNAGHGTSSSDGVDIGTGSVIESIGSGSISIQGRAGSGSSSDGVEISDTTIQSVDGTIGIIGDASNADSSSDGVELDDSLVMSVGGPIQITGNSMHAGSSADGVDINDSSILSATGHVQVTGTATGAGSSADGIELANGAIIQTSDGPITIIGQGQLDGVYMTGTSTEISSVAGTITIDGTGGGISSAEGVHIAGSLVKVTTSQGDIQITGNSGGDDDGVEIENGARVSSTGIGPSAGTITITGTGGSGTTDYGVALVDTDTTVISVDGNIIITGTSPGGDGVNIGGAAIVSSTGLGPNAAQIEINGTGGGLSSSEGLMITGIGTVVTSIDGDIRIIGDSGGDDDGVEIHNGALISSTGIGMDAASITINGTGGIGTTDYGIELADVGTVVSSVNGNIQIIGISPGGDGAYVGSGAVISSTGTGPDAAQVNVEGTGGGVSSSEGVMITGIGTVVTSIDGDVQIRGDSGGDDDGVEIHNGALISSTGIGMDAATITVNGTGGSGTTDYGIELADVGTVVSSVNGNIQITGMSPGGDGVYVGSGAVISSTGTGPDAAQVNVEGTGGGVSSSEGVMITGIGTVVTSIDGDIQIIGDSGGDDDGVEIHNGAIISSTGTGPNAATTTVNGTGGSGSTDYGVEISGTGAHIGSVAGHIDIAGTSAVAEGTYIGTGAAVVVTGVNGDITLTANDLALTGAIDAGAGLVKILPANPGLSFDLGSTGGSGQFVITDAEFDRIFTADRIQIGDATAGDISFTDAVDPAGADVLEVISGTVIGDTNTHDPDYTGTELILHGNVAPGRSPGVFSVNSNLVLASNDTFSVEVGGTTPGTTDHHHDQLDVTGAVSIGSNVTLNVESYNGFVPVPGDTFIIVNNDGVESVSGTFAGLPEGSLITDYLDSGLDAVITYQGGDGNDVVINTVSPAAPTTSVPVDDYVSLTHGRVRFDRRTGLMSMDVVVTNTSARTISGPLKLVLEGISSPDVTLANPDGQTSDGKDYVDLTSATDDGSLDPGESVMVRLYFVNPFRRRFTFELGAWGVLP